MSIIERFRSNICGGIKFTGNSLVVSKLSENVREAYFITADSEKRTTKDFSLNGSGAFLNLPKESEITYAELIWGGSYKAKNLGLTEPLINSSVKFTLPDKTAITAVPDSTTRFNAKISEENDIYNYIRSATVTKWVKRCGSGYYTVGSVPAYIENEDGTINNFAAAGWTLAVIYKSPNPNSPKKHICLYVGNLPVSDDSKEKGIVFRGFPNTSGKNEGAKLLLSAVGGNFYLSGNSAFFYLGGKKYPLYGNNNDKEHLFSSNINTNSSYPDKSGTFGENNEYFRIGWDITDINIKEIITKAKNKAVLKFVSEGNPFSLNAAAISIDIKNSKKGSENMIKTAVLSESSTQENTETAGSQLFSQLMLERLYSYGIKTITSCEIQYNSAKVFEFSGEKVLSCNYTIYLSYTDVGGKKMNSVKSGTVTFMNVAESNIENCSVRINRVSAKIEENQVLIKAIVKVLSI